jgi:hypothetical protein
MEDNSFEVVDPNDIVGKKVLCTVDKKMFMGHKHILVHALWCLHAQ